jgi:hypothetical protein
MNTKKIRPLILPVLAAVTIGAISFDFSSRSLQPVRQETQGLENRAEDLRKQTMRARTAQMNDAQISAANAEAVAVLPDEPQLSEVIDQIDAHARSNQLQWTQGAPAANPVSDTDVPAGMSAWTMSASFSGSLPGIYRFLDGIDGIDRLVSVQSFSVQQTGTEYTASFVLRFYALGG